MSSRSAKERYRPDSGFADTPNLAGAMPPASRNHLVPTACDTPASTAAASLAMPAAIAAQNRRRSSRPATGGRPGDRNGARPDRSERRFRILIATSFVEVLRRPLESARFAVVPFHPLPHGEFELGLVVVPRPLGRQFRHDRLQAVLALMLIEQHEIVEHRHHRSLRDDSRLFVDRHAGGAIEVRDAQDAALLL